MFPFKPDQLLIYVLTASPIALLIVIYFTRPGLRRLAGALAGGFAFGALNIAWDILAYYAGWWHYPFTTAPYAPLPFYVGQALFYGAAMALIGWRITRRFGRRGLVVFLAIFVVYGTIHDYVGAAVAPVSNIIVFGAGVAPVIGDALCWGTMAILAQVVMRLIAGSAKADQLARSPTQKQAM